MAGTEYHHTNSGSGNQFVAAGPQNNNPGSGTQYNAHNINFNAARDSDANLFADLRITDPRDDKDRIERIKGGLLRDSYRWILENPDFQAWRNDPKKRLLWVKGDPGKGKTMLLCGLINELADEGVEPVYFFCQATDPRLNTATAVLRGLIYLLLDKRPYLIDFVREKYRHGGKRFFEDANSWIALGKILVGMLCQEDQSTKKIVIIIDALDECTNVDDLVDLVVKLSSTPTSVVVSSRNWPNIQQGMEATEQQRQICLELNEDCISSAVLTYTNHKVDQLAQQKGYDKKLRDEVKSYLLSHSDDTFLWVSLVAQQLEDRKLPKRRTITRLKEFPQGLDSLYRRTLYQALEFEDADVRKSVLAVVSIAFRPLNLKELATLIEPPMDDEPLVEVIGECGSLLVLRDNIVYFLHQSAKEFLLKYCLAEVMPLGIGHQHTLLYSNSLRAMSTTLRKNIYNITSFAGHTDETDIPDPDPLAPVRYSCVRWAQHLSEGLPPTAQEYDRVLAFLTEHYLHWLEAMSFIRCMDESIACLLKLKHLIQNSTELSWLAHLVQDAFRFIKRFCIGIEDDPLQVYSSIVFAPTHSIIKTLYEHEEQHWWSAQMTPPRDTWGKCLQTIELNQSCEITSAVFSSDGKALALDVGLGIIQIRDADTGGWLNALHVGVYDCLSLATFGGRIIAAASEGDVFLFDMLTGKDLGEPIEILETVVSAIAFAPDGNILATGSTEGAILLWDMETRECLRVLQDNSQRGSVESIVFSSNGFYVAAAMDSSVIVWDLRTGWQLRTFVGHEGKVVLVAFAPDNQHVQSASSDGTVKMWNMETSSCLRTIDISIGQQGMVAFSSDLTQIASVSHIISIQLWDSATGCLLGSLKHGGDVKSIVFSPDDTILMSATQFDATIKFWDLTDDMESSLTPLSHGDQSICSMAFSSDGAQLAVASTSTLQIWNSTTGQCLRTLNEWRIFRGVASVTFCNSGILLAKTSECNRNVAEIWNVCTKVCLQSLADERISRIEGLEFSPDSATLAILTVGTVSLWDVAEGSCRVVYKSPDPYFSSNNVKFSETGSHLYHYNWKDGEDAIRWEDQIAPTMGIQVAPLDPIYISGYSIQDRQSWVKRDGENMIWIPPEFRARSYASWGSMMALADGSGRVTFLRFT